MGRRGGPGIVVGDALWFETSTGRKCLAIHTPVRDGKAGDCYPAVFSEASERIGIAAWWLRERGTTKVVLVSHSMGSCKANAYVDATPQSPYVAWVCMGLTGGYSWATCFSRPLLLREQRS